MSLPHALLTALIERPSSGSDLAARFDRSIGYFWNATHQQIYRELARLETAGLIESLPEQSGRGRKRAYRILEPGRAELERWVSEGEAAPLAAPYRSSRGARKGNAACWRGAWWKPARASWK